MKVPVPLPPRDRSATKNTALRAYAALLWTWLAALVVGLAGCSKAEPPLKVGTYSWPGFATLHYASAQGMLDPAAVPLLEFGSAREVMAAFRAGAVDAAGMTLDEALTVANGSDGIRIVLVFDFSAGADVLLARPAITTLRGLRGKRVGVESGAEGDYILRRVLEIARLRPEDVEVVDLPMDRHLQAYRNNEVDAVITFDPVRVELLSAGARELFSSRAIASEIMDVLVVREDAIRTRPNAISMVANGHFRTVERIRANPAAVAQVVAPRYGPPGEVLEAWRLIEFQGRVANQRLLSEGSIRPVMEQVHAVIHQTRLQGKALDALSLVDDRFVQSERP